MGYYRHGGGVHRLGIVLAGTRRIGEQHGGTVSVASQEGVGSIFTVRLPLAPPGGSRARS